jgi:hypothetical protein
MFRFVRKKRHEAGPVVVDIGTFAAADKSLCPLAIFFNRNKKYVGFGTCLMLFRYRPKNRHAGEHPFCPFSCRFF